MMWFDNYNTGNKIIDMRQREFLQHIYSFKEVLSGGMERSEREVGTILKYLVSYVSSYFALEEEYIKKKGCPNAVNHIKEHREFTQKVFEVLAILKSKRSYRPIQLYYLLKAWSDNHIHGRDLDFLTKCKVEKEKDLLKNEKDIVPLVMEGFKNIENRFLTEEINSKIREDERTLYLRSTYDNFRKERSEDFVILLKSVDFLFNKEIITETEVKRISSYILTSLDDDNITRFWDNNSDLEIINNHAKRAGFNMSL